MATKKPTGKTMEEVRREFAARTKQAHSSSPDYTGTIQDLLDLIEQQGSRLAQLEGTGRNRYAPPPLPLERK